MTAYLDPKSNRLYADTLEELSVVAARVGLHTSRYRPGPAPAYQLTPAQAYRAAPECRFIDGLGIPPVARRPDRAVALAAAMVGVLGFLYNANVWALS